MNFETLERLWQSEANRQTSVAEAYVLKETVRSLTLRRKAFIYGAGLVGAGLIVWTMAIAYAVAIRRNLDLTQEWGSAGMLLLSWFAFLSVGIRHWRHLTTRPDVTASMPEALRALLDENQMAQARTRMIGAALLGFAIILPVCLWQLHAVGKMELRHVIQASLLLGGGMLVSVSIHALKYMHGLRPEEKRLRALLDRYESPE